MKTTDKLYNVFTTAGDVNSKETTGSQIVGVDDVFARYLDVGVVYPEIVELRAGEAVTYRDTDHYGDPCVTTVVCIKG
jgi:hypothetical protein